MKISLAAFGIALALSGASVLAQQQSQKTESGTTSSSSGPTFTEKVKEAAQNIGEKTREAAQKMKEKAQQTADRSKAPDDAEKDRDNKSDGKRDGGSTAAQMQKKADADLKAARAKCASMEDSSQKAICQKQAAAAHANAEVRVEKARAANQASTSTMGAGKSSQ